MFVYRLMVSKEQIMQIIFMNPRNMLTQIRFRSNRFPVFARMTPFLVNCSWDVDDWRLNLGYIVLKHSLVWPNAGVWLFLWFFGVQKYILTNVDIILEFIEGFYFVHRQPHDRVHGSSKIRNSVDNNLLLKIRFRPKSVTFSAVDINRKFWPKRRLHNWYGNTNRGIRKTGVADHLLT